jgi:hypothetical protein
MAYLIQLMDAQQVSSATWTDLVPTEGQPITFGDGSTYTVKRIIQQRDIPAAQPRKN